jgi:membrane protease YdiL (CAAX protease family)
MHSSRVQCGRGDVASGSRYTARVPESGALREVAWVYGVAFAGTAALGVVGSLAAGAGGMGGLLSEAAGAGTALLFFGLALSRARRQPGGAQRFGIDLAGVVEPTEQELARTEGRGVGLARAVRDALPHGARETAVALGLAALIFPPFVVGFYLWHQPTHAFRWSAPSDLASFVTAQLVMVALPEEAFFRGFVQTRLGDAWPSERTVLGARLDPRAWIGQAALFALVHLATEPRLDKLATFFPGLLFGWLRAKRGGIGAALVLHAASNVLADFLVRGWLW